MSLNKKSLKKQITSSSLMQVKLKYNGESFRFNLVDELSISPDKINSELKDQPTYYSFLLLLQSKLIVYKEDCERELSKIYARKYIKFSEKKNPLTGRNYSDKLAKELAIDSEEYQSAYKKLLGAKNDLGIIQSCVRGFEQRSSLIQTLSANLRKES